MADEAGLLVARHQLDDAEAEADRHAPVDAEHHAHLVWPVAATARRRGRCARTLHLQVGVERPGALVVDAGEEVLAARERADDLAPVRSTVAKAGHAEVGAR